MKKNILVAILLFQIVLQSKAQLFSVGANASMNIQSGTIFSAKDLVLTPTADFSIGNNSLSENASVTNSNATTTINEAFKFTNTTSSYTGSVQISYATGALNNIVESSLKPYIHNGTSWSQYNAATNNTSSHYVVSQALSGLLLNELSLTGNSIISLINRPIQPDNDLGASFFEAKAYPNPSPSSFHLKVNTRSYDEVHVIVSDATGRRVKEMKVIPGMDTEFGSDLINGLYFVEIIQGKNRKFIKIEKLQ